MKSSPPTLSPEQLERLLSKKIPPARPRPGFSDRVLDRLPSGTTTAAGGGFPSWALAAAAVVIGLLVAAVVLQGVWQGSPGEVVEAVPDVGTVEQDMLAEIVVPQVGTGLWTDFAVDEGLSAESEALRQDVGRFGNFLARSIPMWSAQGAGIDS